MNKYQLNEIKKDIFKKIGINVEGYVNQSGSRTGLSFWFDNFNRGNGPVFTIRPSGLKRHVISLEFGPYAAPCIEHIKLNADAETYALAYTFIEQLDGLYAVKINNKPLEDTWHIDIGFTIEVTRKNLEESETESIIHSIELIMIPIMAAISELIGYEEQEEPGQEEGALKESVVNKRERNPRNRLLCLSVHGHNCSVCGLDPREVYGLDIGSILEIHHIEPLSELDEARAYNPREDLVPLCPNCHRAIHRRRPAFKPEELKKLLNL